jgi:L-fuconolactonase
MPLLTWVLGYLPQRVFPTRMKAHMTRRNFFQNATVAVLGAAAPFFAGAAGTSSSYVGEIIDTHTHFYDPTRSQGVPWPPKDDTLLYRRVFPADYRELPKPQPVTGTVVVEASAWVEDNQWILDLAAREPFIVGFVGNLVPGADAFAGELKRFSANPVFRGIRIGADRLREGLSSSAFLEALNLLSRRDLTLDIVGGPEILAGVSRLARAVPDLRIIIDHVAGARIDGGSPERSWSEEMKRAGQNLKVCCKVSGLVEGTGRTGGKAPSTIDFYRPVLDVIWEAFGADRLVYGSNWPVSERFAPCAVVQQIVSDYFGSKGEAATSKVFRTNSKLFYKWVDRG